MAFELLNSTLHFSSPQEIHQVAFNEERGKGTDSIGENTHAAEQENDGKHAAVRGQIVAKDASGLESLFPENRLRPGRIPASFSS